MSEPYPPCPIHWPQQWVSSCPDCMRCQQPPGYPCGNWLGACLDCGGPLERQRSRQVGGYEWCPTCRSGHWCACEDCEVFRALHDLW